MKKLLSVAVATTFLVSFNSSYASIWDATNSWTLEAEERYNAWVKSDSVHTKIFQDKNSPYYGIKVDCADTAYALRAIFSFENQLPYKIKNPSYRPGSKTPAFFTNEMNNWDKLAKPEARVVGFLNLVGGALGTEQMSLNDTFPLKVKSTTSGDFFMYKINSNGKAIRHAYIIKDVTPVGNFDLIYSTQARKKDDQPLNLQKNQELSHAPQVNWGFKRFRWPEHYGTTQVSEENGYSLEQYEWAKTLSERDFFKRVKKTLAQETESDDALIDRRLKDLCSKLKERVDSVKAGYEYSVKIKRCMDYGEYDAYSTPNRDGHIREEISKLEEQYKEIVKDGTDNEINPVNFRLLQLIFAKKFDVSGKTELDQYCQVEYKEGSVLDIYSIVQSFKNKKTSFHPNDGIDLRWGVGNAKPTACVTHYR